MPKGFTEQEREKITRRLRQQGRRLFESYGIRKTSVEELTQAAGISKGAFYSFYPSKEELFMDILEEIEVEIREGLMQEAFQEGLSRREALTAFLRTGLKAALEYPFFRNLTGDEYLYLVRKLPEERLKAHLMGDSQAVTGFMQAYNLEDAFTVQDPTLVANVFRALFFITMHRTEIGEEHFAATMDLLVEMVVTYLIRE